jgi:hypothetical protein
MRPLLAILSLALALTMHADRRRAATPGLRESGPCAVRGLANVYYSTDGGSTWSRNAETPVLAGISDMAVLDTDPESIVAVIGRNVYDSQDAGCTWSLRYTIGEEIKHAVAIATASNGRAFLFNEEFLLRYDRGEVIVLNEMAPVGMLAVNPGNREHVRSIDAFSAVTRESFDGGATWQQIGISLGSITAAAFAPNDFDRVILGLQTGGIRTSRDGGRTWRPGPAGRYCDLGFGGMSSDVIWATTPVSSQPWIQRSTNGGSSFTSVAGVEGLPSTVCLVLTTNPHDANVIAVPIPQQPLHLIDAVTKRATGLSCCSGARSVRLAWSPRDPARVYAFALR